VIVGHIEEDTMDGIVAVVRGCKVVNRRLSMPEYSLVIESKLA
jgi:hypothetical protein